MEHVRYATAPDGTALAWRRSGTGPPLVRAATWLTSLEHEHESPVWAHWAKFHQQHFDYLRYDERGCGLSDRKINALDLDTWVGDLRVVIEAAEMPRPFTLLGQSQGAATAVAYASRFPEDVGLLVLAGGFARGVDHRGDARAAALYHAVVEVFRQGFDEENPAFREVWTSRFVPDGDPQRTKWFADLCRTAMTPENAARLLTARAAVDASDALPDVTCPTLVLHAVDDVVVPFAEGQLLARRIRDAEFVSLPSANHILQENEPAWERYASAILARTARGSPDDVALTGRESEILALICAAKSNKEIARELDLSEKTVRNHATNIFAKLGVSTRQQAILKMRGMNW